jgi:hypothetical protein
LRITQAGCAVSRQIRASISPNGEREVSKRRRYGFEIVHGPRMICGTLAAYQLKIYTKSNHSNFMQLQNRGFIRV